LAELFANEQMRIMRLSRSGMVFVIADRSHRFVGDAQVGQYLGPHSSQSGAELTIEYRFRPSGLTLFQSLAHANGVPGVF
jgi:hypothetical protein